MKYVDMHCDTITVLHDKKGSLRSNDLHIDLEKMRKGECLLQNFAVFTDIKKHDSSYTRECIGFYHQQLEENKD
ncbi:MAG: membrane dipeptidase, partial [Erysipelotrichaceae bacterium]|nr:membrane dipeptidase [Erysipelotrichaceae bacterium]